MNANVNHTVLSHETCHPAERGNLGHHDSIILLLLLAIQRQRTQLYGFTLMPERCLNERNRLFLPLLPAAARQRGGLRRAPYGWRLPRVNGGLRYTTTIALSQRLFFWQQLRMNRAIFDTVVNTLGPRIARENSRFRACLCPAKILAVGL